MMNEIENRERAPLTYVNKFLQTKVKTKQKRNQKRQKCLFTKDEEVFFKSPSISFNFQRQPVKKWA